MIIWANLDCEARWGNQTLPQHVLRRISSAGALLAAFAPEGEPVEIWTPAEVDPATVHLPDVTMRVGVPATNQLAWAKPDAKAANDRRLNLALHERLGTLLPGQRVVTSLDDLANASGPWVCKAPWTAAGRDRAHGDGPPAGELAVYVKRLLDRFGALLYEPWCDRVLDLGVCARIDEAGTVTAHAPHTLLNDPRGGFVGIDLSRPPLTDNEGAQLEAVVREAGRALHEVTYAGPFSVDAFVRRRHDVTDKRALHAPCEINARHTFGHVAHALAQRFGARRLGFGRPPLGARMLVEGTAWIEVDRSS